MPMNGCVDVHYHSRVALYKSEADLAQFLQVEGVRVRLMAIDRFWIFLNLTISFFKFFFRPSQTPTVVGTVMSTMGHAVKVGLKL